MGERDRPSQDQEPINVDIGNLEVGKPIKPFEGIKALPAIDPYDQYPTLVKAHFQFRGINGFLKLVADPEDVHNNPITPLGKVRFTNSLENGVYLLEESPLTLELDFDIATLDEFHMLQKYTMEFTLGEEKYYLQCDGEDTEEGVEEEIKKDGSAWLFDDNLRDKQGMLTGRSKGIVLLPYDIARLSQIEAIIVEKEPFNPDFVLLEEK